MPAGFADHLHKQGGGIHAVLAVDMAPHGEAAAALAAQHRVHLINLGGDVLEAHGHLIAGLSKGAGHRVQQVGGGHIANHRTLPALVLVEIPVQQHQNFVGADVLSVAVDHAQPVPVAVHGDAQIVAAVDHPVAKLAHGALGGGGHHAAEEGVLVPVNLVKGAAGGVQNHGEGVGGGAVHGVKEDAGAPLTDGVGIQHGEHRVNEAVEGISQIGEQPGALGRVQGHGLHAALCQRRNVPLQRVCHLHGGVPPLVHDDFHAVVVGGVVAGGDLHAVVQGVLLHQIHHKGGGHAALHEPDANAVCGQRLGHPPGGLGGEEAAVVADHHAFVLLALLKNGLGQRLSHKLKVCHVEVLADLGAPAAGAEFYHRNDPFSQLLSGYSIIPTPPPRNVFSTRSSAPARRRCPRPRRGRTRRQGLPG